jgi:hypothetical protein
LVVRIIGVQALIPVARGAALGAHTLQRIDTTVAVLAVRIAGIEALRAVLAGRVVFVVEHTAFTGGTLAVGFALTPIIR